jgi:hypothetical protein
MFIYVFDTPADRGAHYAEYTIDMPTSQRQALPMCVCTKGHLGCEEFKAVHK